MSREIALVPPVIAPPLDAGFRPAALAHRRVREQLQSAGVPLVIGLERSSGEISRFETAVFPENHPEAAANDRYVERLVKFLLWQRGGFRIYVGGPRDIGESIRNAYAPAGAQQFDYHFMGEQVYERPFKVI